MNLPDNILELLNGGQTAHYNGSMFVPLTYNPHDARDDGFHPSRIGAQQAPDGKWYVPDSANDGKWLRVLHGDNDKELFSKMNKAGIESNRSNGGRADLNSPISSEAAPSYGIRPSIMDQLLPEFSQFQPNSLE